MHQEVLSLKLRASPVQAAAAAKALSFSSTSSLTCLKAFFHGQAPESLSCRFSLKQRSHLLSAHQVWLVRSLP